MDLSPQNLQEESVTVTLEADPDSFLMYWAGALGYMVIVYVSMNLAYTVEIQPYLTSTANADTLIQAVLNFGFNYVVVPTLNPVVAWSMLSYLLPFLFNFLMGFWGGWSLFGVYFANLIFSYGDDIILAAAVSLINDYVSVTVSGVYSTWPTYLLSFFVKTAANIGMIYIASKYYAGWNAHR